MTHYFSLSALEQPMNKYASSFVQMLETLDSRFRHATETTFQVVGDFADIPFCLIFGPDLHFQTVMGDIWIRATSPRAKRWLYETANELGKKGVPSNWTQKGLLCIDADRARLLAADAAKSFRVKWNGERWRYGT